MILIIEGDFGCPLYFNKIKMISVDKVYKTVLYILNKEQRGYVTPAEFNHIAEIEQNAIFWTYFKEGAQVQRLNQANMQSDVPLFDLSEDLNQKLQGFTTTAGSWSLSSAVNWQGGSGVSWFQDVSTGRKLARIKSVTARYVSATGGGTVQSTCDFVTFNEYLKISSSKLTKPDNRNPVFMALDSGDGSITPKASGQFQIGVSPTPTIIYVEGIYQPLVPRWNFTVGAQNQYIFTTTDSQDFELDPSEESRLINNILLKFGVVVRDPGVIQVAMAEQQREAQEK